MAYKSSHGFYRRLTFFLAIFVFFQNVGTASLLHRLPDDPLDMSTHLSLYSWFASILAILGIIGAKKENVTLVAIFANYLIIDVILCAIPRLLAMFFFPEIRGSICSADSINARLQALQSSGFFTTPEGSGMAEHEMTEECMTVVFVMQVFAGLIVAGATLMQIVLAIKVRTYSCMLQARQDIEEAEAIEHSPEKSRPYRDFPTTSTTVQGDEKKALLV